MLLRLMNFFRGERHFYSIAAIQSLMAVGTAVHFWWYDIACRWSLSFEKWLQKQEDPAILDKGRDVVSLIPPWHRYAHRQAGIQGFRWIQLVSSGGTGLLLTKCCDSLKVVRSCSLNCCCPMLCVCL